MKNQFLSFILLLTLVLPLYSQEMTEKGSSAISGSAFFATSSYSEIWNTKRSALDFSIEPAYTYFVFKNFEIGVNIRYGYNENKVEYADWGDARKSITRQYGIGPSIAYYFGDASAKPFITILGFYNKTVRYSADETSELIIGAGYLVPLNSKIALTPIIRYGLAFQSGADDPYTSLSFGASFKLFF